MEMTVTTRSPAARRVQFTRKDGTPARILLAEDDFEMRDLVASALRRDGYEVVEAADGGRLLVQIAEAYLTGRAQETYDLVVSDIRMPVCSGLQILEELRRARWTAPVILMTAFGDEATRTRVEMLDAILFDKPFDVDDLRTAVLNLLTQEIGPRSRYAAPASKPPPSSGPMTLVPVASFEHADDALIAKGRLERAGVHVYVSTPCADGRIPKATSDMGGRITLFIQESERERAASILSSYAARARS